MLILFIGMRKVKDGIRFSYLDQKILKKMTLGGRYKNRKNRKY